MIRSQSLSQNGRSSNAEMSIYNRKRRIGETLANAIRNDRLWKCGNFLFQISFDSHKGPDPIDLERCFQNRNFILTQRSRNNQIDYETYGNKRPQ